MKSLIFLSLVVAIFVLPTEIFSQNKGSLIGNVYTRERDKNTSSLNYSVQNRCRDDDDGCGKQQITKVELRLDYEYYEKSIDDPHRVLPDMRDPFNDEFRAKWEENPNKWFWVQPGTKGVIPSESLNFALSWGDKWKCSTTRIKKDAYVICEDKDPSTPEYNFYGKVDFKLRYDSLLKENFKLKVGYNLDTVLEEEYKPTRLPKLDIKNTIDDCLKPPFVIHPGQYFYSSLSQQNLGNTWIRNYGDFYIPGTNTRLQTPMAFIPFVIKKDTGELVWIPIPQMLYLTPAELFIRAMLPGIVSPNDAVWILGMNVFGELFFYSQLNETLIRTLSGRCSGGVTQATRYVFEGRRLCVCGCYSFDDELDLEKNYTVFTLDGKPIRPVSLSSTTAKFIIPEGTAPGLHKIGYTSPFDERVIAKTVDFRVLKLNGQIDQSALLRGESTTMRLKILGTEDSLPLRITNKTPNIISITGGTLQTVKTSGGSDNKIERNVKGNRVGNFIIDYEIDEAPCPCYQSDF